MDLCKCGCGNEVKLDNRYIHGHNRGGLISCTHGERWSMRYDKCIECGTIEHKHIGQGLCSKCHRKARYAFKKAEKFDKWSKNYSRCTDCGRTDRPHKSNGLCGTCYSSYLNRKKGRPKRNFGAWSWYYDKCIECGTIKRPHAKNGLCTDCYQSLKRDQDNLVKCPVCGVEVNKLNQHLSMRAKKCETHKQYQYNLIKKCFDSELNLADISKELDIDRHAITRLFIKYFGKDSTDKRNEKNRRWCISKAAKINFNYKNMYGTVIYHDSPNQGIVRMRSKIEGLYADKLTESKQDWWYEKYHFHYLDNNGIKRTYTPDFYLPDKNKHIEIKGKNLLKENDLNKIELVSKQNNINIEVIKI